MGRYLDDLNFKGKVHPELWVVMPVFNEAAAIEEVIREWVPTLRQNAPAFTLAVVDDGSTDATSMILDRLRGEIPELWVIRQANAGHGAACLFGYHQALKANVPWIFQIDSDGQCDPAYFPSFWALRDRSSLLFGIRTRREDGWVRWLISRGVSLVVWAATGTWLWDANVPYRLMRADLLRSVIDQAPAGFPLVNIVLAYLLNRSQPIRWIPIRFRRRSGGASSLPITRLPSLALQLFHHLKTLEK